MNGTVRRPFWLALALSLMLHLGALTVPGWRLPLLDEDEASATLDATLVVPVQVRPKPAPTASPMKPPRPKPALAAPHSNAPTDTITAPSPALAAVPAAEAAPSVDAAPVAVPPAPTFAYAKLWPKTGRIVYQVTRGEGGLLVGQSEHRWTHDEQGYELHAVAETVGLAALFRPARVTQTSRGTFSASGLRPA